MELAESCPNEEEEEGSVGEGREERKKETAKGVVRTPMRFPMLAMAMAKISEPLEDNVSTTHMLMEVGRQVQIIIPLRRAMSMVLIL